MLAGILDRAEKFKCPFRIAALGLPAYGGVETSPAFARSSISAAESMIFVIVPECRPDRRQWPGPWQTVRVL